MSYTVRQPRPLMRAISKKANNAKELSEVVTAVPPKSPSRIRGSVFVQGGAGTNSDKIYGFQRIS